MTYKQDVAFGIKQKRGNVQECITNDFKSKGPKGIPDSSIDMTSGAVRAAAAAREIGVCI